MLVLNTPTQVQSYQVLESYATEALCEQEKVRIWRDMRVAHPDDHHDFSFICRRVKAV